MPADQPRQFVGPPVPAEEPQKPMGAVESARLALSPTQRLGLGAGEAALSVGTGMVAAPLNYAWNAGMEALELPTGQPVGTYQPRTPEGQAMLSGVDKAARLTGVPQALEAGMDLENPDPAKRATGNLIGLGLGVIPGIGAMKSRMSRRAAIPTRPEIKAASQQAYQRAEQTGGMLPQNNLGGFVTQVEQMLAKEGFDADLNPNTMIGLKRLYEDATRPGIAGHSVQGAETLRKVLSSAENDAIIAGKGEITSDARLAGQLLDDFDDFIEQQLPSSTAEYRTARNLWHVQRKAQDIENLFDRAKRQAGQYSVSGMQNALRTQFKQLADNPRRIRRFSEAERAAINKVAEGGNIQNFLQAWGKFDPFKGGLPSIGTYIAGVASPDLGLGLAATGVAARHGASAMRKSAARGVDELVRSGAASAMGRRLTGESLPQLGYLPSATLGIGTAEENRRRLLAERLQGSR